MEDNLTTLKANCRSFTWGKALQISFLDLSLNWLKNQGESWGIGQKIYCGYALAVGIAVLGTGGGLLAGEWYKQSAMEQLDRAAEGEYLLSSLKVAAIEVRLREQRFERLVGKPTPLKSDRLAGESLELLQHIEKVQILFTKIEAFHENIFLHSEEKNAAWEQFRQKYQKTAGAYSQQIEDVLKKIAAARGQAPSAARLMGDFSDSKVAIAVGEMADDLTKQIEVAYREKKEAKLALNRADGVRIQIIASSMWLSGTIAVILAILTSRAIASSLRAASLIARQVTEEGNFHLTVPAAGEGEIKELADSLNKLLQYGAATIEELQQSQAELERFFNLSFDMLGIVGFDGYFKRLNPAFEKTLGYTQEELLRKPLLAFVHPDERSTTLAEVEKLYSGVKVSYFENRYRCKDGSYKWLAWTSVAVPDEGLMYGVARDITVAKQAEKDLKRLNEELENRVSDRTTELNDAILELQSEIAARAEAEAALYASKTRLNGILNSLDSVVWSISAVTSKLLYLNPAVEIVYGYLLEEFIENPRLWFEVIHSEDRQRVESEFNAILTSGSVELEYRISRPDGEVRWLHARSRLIYDASGTGSRIDGTVTDITDRKRAEEALRQANEALETRVEARTIQLRHVIKQLKYKIEQQKQTEEALRRSEIQLRHQAQRAELLDQLGERTRQSLDLDAILEIAVQHIRSLLQVDRCLFTWYLSDGELPAWNVVREAKNPDLPAQLGYYPIDAAGSLAVQKLSNLEIYRADNIADLTDSAEREFLLSLGYTAMLSLPMQRNSGAMGIVVCAQHGGARSWREDEIELLQAVGDRLAIAINQAELYADAQHSARLAREQAQQLEEALQELKQTQTQLIHAEKMSSLGQMVAGLAHEINNPVNFIHGNLKYANHYVISLLDLVNLYQQEYPEPPQTIQERQYEIDLEFLAEDLPKLLNSMNVGTERIRQLVLSLRNFSRLDEADVKQVDLHEGIDSALLLLKHRIDRGIAVSKQYGDLPSVECCAAQVNQVFAHAIENAIDALLERQEQSQKQIVIQTEAIASDRILIRIRDNGAGIRPEIKHKIFDPFFTTKPVGQGTGLGLSICYQIVKKHGGKIEVTSEPGQGTEVAIALPVKQSSSTRMYAA